MGKKFVRQKTAEKGRNQQLAHAEAREEILLVSKKVSTWKKKSEGDRSGNSGSLGRKKGGGSVLAMAKKGQEGNSR